MSTEKYKQFRNYMVNELGITREDIEAWTKESVSREVNKRLDRLLSYEEYERRLAQKIESLSGKARDRIDRDLRAYVQSELKTQISEFLVEQMRIEILPKPAPQREGGEK